MNKEPPFDEDLPGTGEGGQMPDELMAMIKALEFARELREGIESSNEFKAANRLLEYCRGGCCDMFLPHLQALLSKIPPQILPVFLKLLGTSHQELHNFTIMKGIDKVVGDTRQALSGFFAAHGFGDEMHFPRNIRPIEVQGEDDGEEGGEKPGKGF